jgi:choline dehydrogenase
MSTGRMTLSNDLNGEGMDDYLRVHGVLGLRVADSSIFPNAPGTHIQAPTVAVAEKCAGIILNGLRYGHETISNTQSCLFREAVALYVTSG